MATALRRMFIVTIVAVGTAIALLRWISPPATTLAVPQGSALEPRGTDE